MNWLKDLSDKYFGPLSRAQAAEVIDEMVDGTYQDAEWDNLLYHCSRADADSLVQKVASECVMLRSDYPPGPEGGYCNAEGLARLKELSYLLRNASPNSPDDHCGIALPYSDPCSD